MSRKFLTAIDLVQSELQNARVQNLAAAPSTPVAGQIYYDTTGNTLYFWNGTAWVSASGVALGAVTAETTFGAASANGVAASASRSDHKHGNPTHVNADHSAITLASLASVFGSVTPETTFGGASADGVGTTASRTDHKHGNPTHVTADHAAVALSGLGVPTTAVNMNGQLVTNVATPVSGTDAANKAYVDGVAAGLDPKPSVRLLSTTLVGGTASGAQTIDGVATAVGDRVLINNGTNATNGVYVVAAGVWARALDMDSWAEVPGAFMFVEEGTLYADTGWVSTANTGGTLGTTAMPFTQFSGPGSVIAGNGLTQTGNQIDVVAADASIVVTANAIAAGLAGTGSAVTVARSDHTHAAPPTTRYNVNVGGATSVVVNHALGTRDVQVQVYRVAAPYDTIECDVERTDTANVTVRFTVAPAAGEYRVTVMA
jgi:hypothetical protein